MNGQRFIGSLWIAAERLANCGEIGVGALRECEF
jgi:hypothetical protein